MKLNNTASLYGLRQEPILSKTGGIDASEGFSLETTKPLVIEKQFAETLRTTSWSINQFSKSQDKKDEISSEGC